MTRRERLLNTLQGKPVDRPPVSFYELDWFVNKYKDGDRFNIFNDPSWRPLLDMTRDRVDRINLVDLETYVVNRAQGDDHTQVIMTEEGDERRWETTIKIGNRTLQSRSVQYKDTFTVWTTEHLLKSSEDLEAYITLPVQKHSNEMDSEAFFAEDRKLGEDGIMLIDTMDPLCAIAPLFSMEDYTITAMTEPELFSAALDWAAVGILERTRTLAKAFPGQLWRIVGPEYASEPYLPPHLFARYVTPYIKEMVDIVHSTGGYVRVHSHGNLKNIMPHIMATGCDGLDPIEPVGQGDVTLKYMRENYGKELVLFGNLEIADIENLPEDKMRDKVLTALDEGTSGSGRGMVLMPSASPYGRKLSPQTLKNYEVILSTLDEWSGQ